MSGHWKVRFYSCLPYMGLFVPFFPEILSRLIFSDPIVISTTSALDDTMSRFARNLLLVCCHYFSTGGKFKPRFIPNTLLLYCSETEYLQRVICPHKLLPGASVGPDASFTVTNLWSDTAEFFSALGHVTVNELPWALMSFLGPPKPPSYVIP